MNIAEMKERIRILGNDFANKESRDELYRLINSYLHERKKKNP